MHRLLDVSGGKVPVIKDGDMVMPDSDKIVVYLEDKHPGEAGPCAWCMVGLPGVMVHGGSALMYMESW